MGIFFHPQETTRVVTGAGGGFMFLADYTRISSGGWSLLDALPFGDIFVSIDWQGWSDEQFPATIPPGTIIETATGGTWVADDYYDLLDAFFAPIGSVTSILGYEMGWRLSGAATYGRRGDNLYTPAPDPLVYPTGPCTVQGIDCVSYENWPDPEAITYGSWGSVLASEYGGWAETSPGWWWLLSHSNQAACDLVVHSEAYARARCPREAWTAHTGQSPETYVSALLTSLGITWQYYKPYYYLTYVQVWGVGIPYGGQQPGFRRRKPGKKGFPIFPPLLPTASGFGGLSFGLKVDKEDL